MPERFEDLEPLPSGVLGALDAERQRPGLSPAHHAALVARIAGAIAVLPPLADPSLASAPSTPATPSTPSTSAPPPAGTETAAAQAAQAAASAAPAATTGAAAAAGTTAAVAGVAKGTAALVALFAAGTVAGGVGGAALHAQLAEPKVVEKTVYVQVPASPPPAPAPVAAPVDPTPTPVAAVVPAPKPPKPRSDVDLAVERDLLESARLALAKGNALDALEAVHKHQARFPKGRLSEERESIAVQALLASGRKDEARGRAEAFKKSYPDSLLLPLVESLLQKTR